MKPKSHEYADMFPMLEGKDLQSLADDIKSNGQNEPIIIYEGKILDGRNRYAACELAGVKPITREFDGTDALSFVISQNLHRRHLSESQRGMVGAMIANLEAHRPKLTSAIALVNPPVTQKSAAEMLNIGVDSIKRSKTVMRDGIPELVKAVETGQVAVTRAARIAKLPPEDQPEAMKEPSPEPKPKPMPQHEPMRRIIRTTPEGKLSELAHQAANILRNISIPSKDDDIAKVKTIIEKIKAL